MKNKKIFGFCILSFAFAAVFSCVMLSHFQYLNAFAEQGEPSFNEKYHINEQIPIPDYYVTIGGETIKADKTVITPSKRMYRKNIFVPSERGLHTVRYSAENFRKEYNFQVDDTRYHISGEGSASWSTNKHTPNYAALNVSLESGATFYFDEIVNIKELGSKRPLINFYYVTDTPAIADVYTIKMRFTDVYDESKYLQLEVEASREGPQHGAVYLKAAGENQTPTGYEANWDRLHVGTIFGFAQSANAYCCNTDQTPLTELGYFNNSIRFYYDYESMLVSTNPNPFGQTDICDLNNSKYFTEFWEGMTTGECKFSLWYENVLSARPTICITDIAGGNLKDDYFVDEIEPSLNVNNVFGNMPEAIVNQKYRFLKASAVDQYDGVLEPEIKVYRDYYTDRSEVPCDKYGFIPKRIGLYYVEYIARDHSGNQSKKLFTINCVNEARDFALSLKPGYATEGYVGKEIQIGEVVTTGNIGEAISEVTLVYPNGQQQKIDKSFTPSVTGSYQVKYVVSDFIGTTKELSYDVNVTVSEAPIIIEKPSLLKYYLAGFEYTLPDLYGIDYNVSETTEVKATISIIDNGVTTPISGSKVTFNVSNNHKRDVVIRYTVSNSLASDYVDYIVSVITTSTDGYIHMDNYFDRTDFTVSSDKNGVAFSSTSNGSAIFTNPLAISGFNFDFSFVSGFTSFTKFNVYLINSINEEEVVKVTYLPGEGVPYVIVNDNDTFVFSGSGLTDGGEQFVQFDIENYKISTNGDTVIPVKKYLNGEKFAGFSSDAVYLKFEFENDTQNEVKVNVTNLNGQGISSSKYDYIKPRVVLSEDYGGARDINEIIKLCTAKTFDVLDPCPSVTLTAYDGSNQIVSDLDGNPINKVSCEVEHFFKATQYCNYRIDYSAKDYDDNKVNFVYSISIYDRVAPTIRLNGTNPKTTTLNSTVKLASATVSDNLSASSNIIFKLYVVTPTGYIDSVNNYSYKFTQKGKYIIRYFAVDEAGNVAILDNEIIVE